MSNGHSNPPTKVELVDRGRGMQLSNSRITVQDLVPYFIRGESHEVIQHWLPTLSLEEIDLVWRYFEENKEKLLEEDRRINAYREEQIRLQRLRFPEFDPEADRATRFARLKRLLEERKERDRAGSGGGRQ